MKRPFVWNSCASEIICARLHFVKLYDVTGIITGPKSPLSPKGTLASPCGLERVCSFVQRWAAAYPYCLLYLAFQSVNPYRSNGQLASRTQRSGQIFPLPWPPTKSDSSLRGTLQSQESCGYDRQPTILRDLANAFHSTTPPEQIGRASCRERV